ncbi:hypothetical protein [Geomonas sp. Red32]|uniref:hypothetical protein n=1 Tax=Geomonas sp. Red32 TaxID=2912856 RepID=UPI00202CE439|nr:hypothetical protein [Geomonas sp. Red32]
MLFAEKIPTVATKDGKVAFDEARFPAKMKAGVAILNTKCESCHSLDRIFNALETGYTISGSSFKRADLKPFVIKKMRRSDINMSTQQAAELLRTLQYLVDQDSHLAAE